MSVRYSHYSVRCAQFPCKIGEPFLLLYLAALRNPKIMQRVKKVYLTEVSINILVTVNNGKRVLDITTITVSY
jgi:hypothetical protein